MELGIDRSKYCNFGCGFPLTHCICGKKPLGWLCPKCKRGLAPHVTVCPCEEDVELTSNPDFIDAMTRIVDAIENTDFDFSRVRVVDDIMKAFTFVPSEA